MSLFTLGTKPRTYSPAFNRTAALEAVDRHPQTREVQLSGGRALMRHFVLATMIAGSAIYGLLMAVTFT